MFSAGIEVIKDFVSYFSLRSTRGRSRAFILVLILVGSVIAINAMKDTKETSTNTEQPRLVSVISVEQLRSTEGATLIGTVEAKSRANLQAEASGRLTAVSVEIGDTVSAGSVIARIENSAQYASLLQAEGVYEAALASAAQSDVSVTSANTALASAESAAHNALLASYNTVENSLLTVVDIFLTDITENIVGVRIDVGKNNQFISDRLALEVAMDDWQNRNTNSTHESLLVDLAASRTTTKSAITLIEILLAEAQESSEVIDGVAVSSYITTLTTTRANLNGVLSAIDSAATSIESAKESVRVAQIASSDNNGVSAADAQLKQALGSLRAAQSAYQKTLITSPISGTVNELAVANGDFVSMGTKVALIANNSALEITVYAGERDLPVFQIGGKVLIDQSVSGTVTAIAPAVDSVTRKTEIKIAAESSDLTAGESVTITALNSEETSISNPVSTADEMFFVPITALKFSATNGTMFGVEDGKLVSLPVEVGTIQGNTVAVKNITAETEFVEDVRGLSVGQAVEVTHN